MHNPAINPGMIFRACLPILAWLTAAANPEPAQWAEETDEAVEEVKSVCRLLLANPTDVQLLNRLKYAQTSIKDVQTRSKFLAVYCLGAYAAGKREDAGKAKHFIETYSTNCDLLPALAAEKYMAECPACKGTGKVRKQCKQCNGTGRCVTCQGKGSRPGIDGAPIKCAACGGSGKCKHCEGTGRVAAQCQNCSGAGVAFSKALARNAFVSALNAVLAPATPAPAEAAQPR